MASTPLPPQRDIAPLDQASKLIGDYLDQNPLPLECCDHCGRPTLKSSSERREREILMSAMRRIRRAIDHHKLGQNI